MTTIIGLAFFAAIRLSRMKFARPWVVHPPLVFPCPVLEVEHRVLLLARVVPRRAVNERPPGLARDLRVVPQRPHLAVGHVLRVVEVHTLLRDLDTAGLPAIAEVGLAAGVVDRHSIDDQPVVVEPRDGGRGGDRPGAVRPALHVEGPLAQPVVGPAGLELHLLGVRGLQAEAHPAVGVDARVLGTRHVGHRRLRVVGLHPR
jgi:hypothetical protein